jgi:hydrogen cyanide synthase HcnC
MRNPEVIVIGAGAVGCSVAYQLARRGKAVTLLDQSRPGSGTSATNFGLVWVQSKQPHTYMEFSLASSRLWPALVDELGEDVGLRQGGGLTLCLTEEELSAQEAVQEAQRQSPLFEGRMLSPKETRDMQPAVSADIKGAAWSPHDGDVNWIKWTEALAGGCRRAGVDVRPDTVVTDLERDSSGAVTGVNTSDGQVESGAVVVSAGIWSRRILESVGVHLDLRPVKGQMLVTEPTDLICPVPMGSVRQDPEGSFYLGVTHEEAGWDVTPTEWAKERFWRRHLAWYPPRQTSRSPATLPAFVQCRLTASLSWDPSRVFPASIPRSDTAALRSRPSTARSSPT